MTMGIILVVLYIAVLAVVLIYPERSAAAISRITVVVYLALAAMALSAVAMPSLYETLAERSLEQMGVRARIEAMDDRLVLNDLADISDEIVSAVETVTQQPTSVLDAAAAAIRSLQSLGQDSAAQGQAGAEEGAQNAAEGSQILMDNVYPSLVAASAVLLRIGALVASLAGLAALIAIHLSALAARKLRALSATQADIEARLQALEARERLAPSA